MTDRAIALLHGADQRLQQLVEKLTLEDMALATPCAGWDVRATLSHTLESIEAFSAAVDGGRAPTEEQLFEGADVLGDDPSGVAKRIIERSHAAWDTVTEWDDVTVQTVLGPMPIAKAIAIVTFSTLVHSWDLAWALGEGVEFTAAEATLAEAVGNELVAATRAYGLYGAEVPAPAQATATQRVIAFTGRAPL
jgi:uncharacterized protein (TIGR03086 family)